ncbi:MAG TPA: universal stress protein [Steroidobacteraceae bacterium]|nr:universal stress protein [Steroidobacteraceae bacterium]
MDAIRTIVALTDFSFAAHRAARRAGLIAKQCDAALHLLHVIDTSPTPALLRGSSAFSIEKALTIEAERSLDSLAEDVHTFAGTTSARLVREGRLIDEMIAAGANADLMVLGPRGVNPLRDLFLGAAAQRIARMVERPMLVVKQDPTIAYENILVPVDFSDYSLPALQFARALAPRATVHILHAIHGSIERTLRGAGVSDEGVASYIQELQREASESMALLRRSLNDEHAVSSVRSGDARVLIPEYASATGCTLIVMGKQGRSWLSEHVLGSVTRHIIEHATCDVAVVPHE